MINVLFVAGFPIYENKGGVQRVTSTLAKALKAKNIGVQYLTLKQGEKLQLDGIDNHFLPNASGFKDPENITFLENLLKENNINCIINQSGIFPNVINFLRSNSPKEVKIFSVHHNCISCLQENYKNIVKGGIFAKVAHFLDYPWFWKILLVKNKRKYANFFRNVIAKSDKLVLLSETFIPELKTYLSTWPTDKVTSIYNPAPFIVHPEALNGKENRLLYVGRVEYTQKQCDLLLPLWEEIQQKFPDWHFDIVGGGSKLKELMSVSAERELKHIHFHGFCDPKPFLEKAKVLIMTSTFEGYGMVLVEAQAYGVVPIAFNSFSSLSSIIENGHNGITVRPFDLSEYVEKLSLLLQNEPKRMQMAQFGQQTVKKFMPDIIAQEWLNLINSKI